MSVTPINPRNRPPDDDEGDRKQLLTIAEVAHRLNVEVRHIRRLVYERRIPFIRWGHLLRFDPDELKEWIDLYRQRPRRGA